MLAVCSVCEGNYTPLIAEKLQAESKCSVRGTVSGKAQMEPDRVESWKLYK